MAFAADRVYDMFSPYGGDPDSVMDMLPLRMPSDAASVFTAWRSPFQGARVIIGRPMPARGMWRQWGGPTMPLQWEDDDTIRSLVARLDTQLVMNLRRFTSPQPRPPLPPNKKRAAKRAKRAEHKARTQERRAHQRRTR